MNIEIESRGIPVEKDVEHFVRCRADLALNGLRDQINTVSVVVSEDADANDDNRIRCLALIRLSGQRDVVVEGTHRNLYVSIHRTLDDAGWSLAQTLAHQQSEMLHQQFELIEGDHATLSASRAHGSAQAA